MLPIGQHNFGSESLLNLILFNSNKYCLMWERPKTSMHIRLKSSNVSNKIDFDKQLWQFVVKITRFNISLIKLIVIYFRFDVNSLIFISQRTCTTRVRMNTNILFSVRYMYLFRQLKSFPDLGWTYLMCRLAKTIRNFLSSEYDDRQNNNWSGSNFWKFAQYKDSDLLQEIAVWLLILSKEYYTLHSRASTPNQVSRVGFSAAITLSVPVGQARLLSRSF